jgi:hypothetical protein
MSKLDGDLRDDSFAHVLDRNAVLDSSPASLRHDASEDGESRPLLLSLDLLPE